MQETSQSQRQPVGVGVAGSLVPGSWKQLVAELVQGL